MLHSCLCRPPRHQGKVGSDKRQCRELANLFHLSTDNFDTFKQVFSCTNWVWAIKGGVWLKSVLVYFLSHCLFNGMEVHDFSWATDYEIMLGGFVLHYIHDMETMKMSHCIVNHNIFWILFYFVYFILLQIVWRLSLQKYSDSVVRK